MSSYLVFSFLDDNGISQYFEIERKVYYWGNEKIIEKSSNVLFGNEPVFKLLEQTEYIRGFYPQDFLGKKLQEFCLADDDLTEWINFINYSKENSNKILFLRKAIRLIVSKTNQWLIIFINENSNSIEKKFAKDTDDIVDLVECRLSFDNYYSSKGYLLRPCNNIDKGSI